MALATFLRSNLKVCVSRLLQEESGQLNIIEILLNWNHLEINIHTRRVRLSTNY